MPPSLESALDRALESVWIRLFPLAFNAMTWIFFVGDVLMTGRLLFIGAFAIYDRLLAPALWNSRATRRIIFPGRRFDPGVHEEKVIARTVRSALVSTYPNLQVHRD